MARQYETQLYTLEEFERMIDEGVFHEDEHIELIHGEIVEMPPIGFDHGGGVSDLIMAFAEQVGKNARIWVQSPIRVIGDSRPEPDLALLKSGKTYNKNNPPMPQDVILVVEVAVSTLKYDRITKGPLYAQEGIPEYWIVNLKDHVIEVYTDPIEGAYKQVRKARRGDTLQLPSGLTGAVAVSDILASNT